MKRIMADLLITFALLRASSTCVAAQSLDIDRFLEGVSAHPVNDQAERDLDLKLFQALHIASPAEVERVLPVLLQYSRPANEVRTRQFAVGFLLSIAMRPDGPELLSSKSEEISSLLVDASPAIQDGAIAVTDWVLAKPVTNIQLYVAAMLSAVQKQQTPQELCVNIVSLLLSLKRDDPAAMKSVVDFLNRGNLTVDTRTELVHELPAFSGLPEQASHYLVSSLDDPDLHVRAMALVSYAESTYQSRAFAGERKHPDPRLGPGAAAGLAAVARTDSTTSFHVRAKDRVQRMAHDPHEDPRIRALAKDAIAGKYPLSPNYDLPPYAPAKH